jgi:putative membrane protein
VLHPAVCWACGVGAMWVWHAPVLCNAAAESRAVSAVQTVSLLLMGGAFWWQLLAPCESQRIAPLRGVVYLFAACAACTVLGMILTFSPVTVCRAYLSPVDRLGIEPMIVGAWGMTPGRDEQIGGLMMWVPMCLVYLSAIIGQIARWYGTPGGASVPLQYSAAPPGLYSCLSANPGLKPGAIFGRPSGTSEGRRE